MATPTAASLPRLQPVDDSSAIITSPIDAEPITSARPTPAASRHRRSASEIKPDTPAARRMSMSATPQVMQGRVPGAATLYLRKISQTLRRAARRPILGMAALLSFIVITATAYSSTHSIALDTSLYPSPSRTAYFAQKTNPFNQYFVKLAWLHTSLIYLPHLITSHSPLLPHLTSYVLSTAFWAIFTTWFFGRGLGDRIIELSGGKCVIAFPASWGLVRETVEEMMTLVPAHVGASLLSSTLDSTTSSLADTANIAPPEDTMYLSVPTSLCTSHAALTPKSQPDLFAILSALPFPNSVYSQSERPMLSIPRPRWYRGHDISGHVFILVLSTLLLTRRLVPTWRRWLGGSGVGQRRVENVQARRIHAVLTVLGTALVGLWLWMTAMTAIYFHNPQEKMSGLVLGLTTAFLVDTFTPSSSSFTTPTSTPSTSSPIAAKSKLPPVLDENGARRLEVDGADAVESAEGAAGAAVDGKEKAE